jgi:TolB-like protein
VFSVFLLAGAVFFVPVLVFSWAYEITPEGVKRESEVDRSHSITHRTGRKLDLITIGMLVAVVAFVMAERTWFSQPVDVAADAPADSTSEGDQAFFVEGLSEEILNVLAQVPGLKVAGRTSSFAFKGKDSDLREIGEALNVAHILEGSVRKAGNRIRVTAQLIQASDGFHLFSKTYDRDLTDVFAVQDDLAALIGEALQTELTGEDDTPSVAQTNIEAYDYYLLARQRLHSRSPELMTEAGELLDRALAIDPNYAPALAQRALVWSLLSDGPGAYGDIPEAVAVEEGLASVTRALEIDPRLAEAHAILGLIVGDLPGRHDEGAASLRRALELNPNSDDGKVWLARITSDFGESVELNEQVVARNPLFGPAFNNLISLYNRNAEFDRSEALIDRVERISGSDINVHQARGEVALMRGELSEAVRHFDVAFAANPNGTIVRGHRCHRHADSGHRLPQRRSADQAANCGGLPGWPRPRRRDRRNRQRQLRQCCDVARGTADSGVLWHQLHWTACFRLSPGRS